MARLQDKVAIITGSSSGLGRAIAIEYFRQGALIVCADLRPKARPQIPEEVKIDTHDLIISLGGKAIFVKVDVGVMSEVQNMVDKTVEEFGRLDIIVNNAGISLESGAPPARLHETSEEVWDTTMRVNTKSIFLCCKSAIPQMLKQEPHSSGDRGWIINMSSIYGLVAGNFNSSYAASKAAVANLTKQVALDYGKDKIHCNAVCPGYTQTAIFVQTTDNLNSFEELNSLHPLKGVGEVKDIVGAAVFLASADAAWITGVCLPVDGGFTAR